MDTPCPHHMPMHVNLNECPVIIINGRTKDGVSVSLRGYGFFPFMYVANVQNKSAWEITACNMLNDWQSTKKTNKYGMHTSKFEI